MFNRTEAHVENFGHEDEQLDSNSNDMGVGFQFECKVIIAKSPAKERKVSPAIKRK